MFTIDERLKGLPAQRDQVVQLYQSVNHPHLAVPGCKAGAATGYVVGLRGPSGFAVFVYLHLPDSGECAVYAPAGGAVPADRYHGEEAEALAFAESMGLMMSSMNFRGQPVDEQERLLRTLPVFLRQPPPSGAVATSAAAPRATPMGGAVQLGRLFSAFCLSLAMTGCAHVSDKDRELAQIQYDLSLTNLVAQPQSALKEVDEALKFNPGMPEAWHVRGILLHTAFGRLEEAHAAYLKALELKPGFSEAHTNLGNLYIDMKRYDDAIGEYEKALNDVLFKDTFIAQGNMGWAYFKKGQIPKALEHLKASTTLNPKYCLGHLKLGQLYEQQQSAEDSCKYFGRYREHCPDRADAWQLDGVCRVKKGEVAEARKSFDTCVEKATTDDQKDLCRQLKGQLAP
jgi:type IV pilus assembly protein PilF